MRLALILLSQLQSAGFGREGEVGLGLETGPAFPWVPALLLAVPAVVALGLAWMYFRTARRMRQAQLAPPVWLLPYLEPREDAAPVWPPTQSSADVAADLAERAESVGRLARRKRAILLGLALNFVAGWAAAGAYLYESKRGGEFQEVPPTSILGASLDTLSFAGLEGAAPDPELEPEPPEQPDPALDTAAVRIRNEQRQAFFRRRDSLALVARADSEARATAEAQRLRDSIAAAVRDSIARAAVVVTLPPPPPPTPPPPPPPPDPAVELARVTDVITAAARGLVAGITSSQRVPETVVPASDRARFTTFVTENRPGATLVSVSEPVIGAGQATAEVVVQFQWRGSFGDTRRRAIRFRAEASRTGSAEWRLAGLTPLDAPP